MPNNSAIRAKKIKGIIAVNLHRGEQVCADKINQGGFPAPGHARKWGPEHIKPMMAGEICLKPVKKPPKIEKIVISAAVLIAVYDIIFRNSVTTSAFVRAAVMEKIEREGLR
jgi:hypothetical protein